MIIAESIPLERNTPIGTSDIFLWSTYAPHPPIHRRRGQFFLKENYITITGSSLEYPKTKDRVNHDLFHESVIFYCKKENIIKNKKKKNSKYILSPKSSIDQTNLNLYIKNSIQYKILKIFNKKFNKIKNDKFLIAAISFKLKKIQFEGKTNKNKKINSKFYLNKILELFKNI